MSELTRFCGILRGQESFGQSVAFGLNTEKWKGGRVPLGVNTVLLVLAAYPTWLAMREHVPIEAADDPAAANTELSDGESRKVSSDDGAATTIVQQPNKAVV